MRESVCKPIRIVSVDGSDIYRSMHRIDGGRGLSVKDKNGKIETKYFKGFLDPSLDTDRLKKVYAAHKELSDSFIISKCYTTAVVNVTFDFAVKEFYNKGERLFVRNGYDVRWDMLRDHVYVTEVDGVQTLIAIEVQKDGKGADKSYAAVENPLDDGILESFFYYDEEKKVYGINRKKKSAGAHSLETTVTTVVNKKEVRDWLYENGFDMDGEHYVRYKRSAGSSREGHCLFIKEPLYADMMEWSSCGLDSDTVSDQASWQAYISLTLGSTEGKIHIPRQSILLLKDQCSYFTDRVVRVSEQDGGLVASEEEVTVKNVIWDGEALLDRSVFEENGYSDKGMMLLRNRFFKTCAFNTNLKEWFSDNGITKPSQLNGICSAKTRSINDIKLVITESSLKYLKFKPDDVPVEEWFEKWLDQIYVDKETSFYGVLKTDKATGPMGNRMVKTNYQLLNTLALSDREVERLLLQSFDFLHKLQRDPMYVRYYANLFVADENDDDADDGATVENYRQRLVSDLMRRTDKFEGTAFYSEYRSELCRSFKNRLRSGKIPVDGRFHTLLGNGLEFLQAVIDKNYVVDQPAALRDGEIYAPRFADGEELLCERSPHITMGNLLVAKNKVVPEIDKYFNLGSARSIVCVNAIRSNLQQRLNGCDYDSDFMLITNNRALRDAAKRNYGSFLVPYCDVLPGGVVSYTTSPADLSELDVKISENKIGEIVNLAQFLNSLYWDRLSRGEVDHLDELYADICKLAVLSGMEIDKAKRLFNVSADTVLADLRSYKKEYMEENGRKIPTFFVYITGNKSKDRASTDAKLETAMSIVFDAVKNDPGRCSRTKYISYTDLFDIEYEKADPHGTYVKRRESILEFVEKAQQKIRKLNFTSKNKNRAEKYIAKEETESLFNECKRKLENSADDHLYGLLLKELDSAGKGKRRVDAFHSLLFAVMCYANDGYLIKRLKKTDYVMHDLLPLYDTDSSDHKPEDEILVFGYPHIMGRKGK